VGDDISEGEMMNLKKNKTKISFDLGGSLILPLLFAVIGYFVYGGVGGFFGILLIGIVLTFALVFSFIPYIGGFIYLVLNAFLIVPAILNFVGLWWTTLVTIMLMLFSIFSIIFSVLIGIACSD